MRAACTAVLFTLASVIAFISGGAGCSSDGGGVPAGVGTPTDACSNPAFRFPNGGDGHAEPLGAAAARQARAGKITRATDIVQSPTARHKVRLGDFVLANDKVAVYIEAENVGASVSDGYFSYGGEILAVEPIGKGGRPLGVSSYGESTLMFDVETLAPDKVSVLADGRDGKAAIIRAQGVLKVVTSLDAFAAFFPTKYDLPVAVDYVLEPGTSKVAMRYSVANSANAELDLAPPTGKKVRLAVFQQSRSLTFTETAGYGDLKGETPFIAWDNGQTSWLMRSPLGPMSNFLAVAGADFFNTPSFKLGACETKTVDLMELVVGGPGIDGLLETKRTTYGEPAWRELRGSVREQGGAGLAGAVVHAQSNGAYLTRAIADANGSFVLHVPSDRPVDLTPTLKGWDLPAATLIQPGSDSADLVLPPRASITVDTIDEGTKESIPVRVQIISGAPKKAPKNFGIEEESDDRVYREYVMSGKATFPVPPGSYRVVVTRGYEYELSDTTVVATAGQTAQVPVALKHSVDSANVMCGDFHIHSFYSADSSDPVERKVKSAIADGLEIPVSSEHEYVIDFQPIVEQLGMTKWAYGMSAEELSTFKWGHFGVFPLTVQPDATNNGAIDSTHENPPALFPQVAARPDRPLFIVNHPRAGGIPPIGQGYFDLAGFDRTTLTGSNKDYWSDAFGALEVFNDSDFDANRENTVADWFAFLNAGKQMPAVGSSDSHSVQSQPVGYPRTCMRFGHDDPRQLTPGVVRDALAAGASTVSGGLFLSASGPNGITPGGTSTAGKYKVVVASPSWIDTKSVEVIVDGTTAQTIPIDPLTGGAGPGHRYELEIDVAATQSKTQHWVIFHARGDGDLAPLHPGRKAFAVSNPIYF